MAFCVNLTRLLLKRWKLCRDFLAESSETHLTHVHFCVLVLVSRFPKLTIKLKTEKIQNGDAASKTQERDDARRTCQAGRGRIQYGPVVRSHAIGQEQHSGAHQLP